MIRDHVRYGLLQLLLSALTDEEVYAIGTLLLLKLGVGVGPGYEVYLIQPPDEQQFAAAVGGLLSVREEKIMVEDHQSPLTRPVGRFIEQFVNANNDMMRIVFPADRAEPVEEGPVGGGERRFGEPLPEQGEALIDRIQRTGRAAAPAPRPTHTPVTVWAERDRPRAPITAREIANNALNAFTTPREQQRLLEEFRANLHPHPPIAHLPGTLVEEINRAERDRLVEAARAQAAPTVEDIDIVDADTAGAALATMAWRLQTNNNQTER